MVESYLGEETFRKACTTICRRTFRQRDREDFWESQTAAIGSPWTNHGKLHRQNQVCRG